MASIPTDPEQLWHLQTLAQLRLALPATLLAILALRFAAGAFTGLIGRIQAQGWVEGDDGYGPLEDELPKANDEDEIHPVVVKVSQEKREECSTWCETRSSCSTPARSTDLDPLPSFPLSLGQEDPSRAGVGSLLDGWSFLCSGRCGAE